ncbi:MAG: crossover junction endodeoxyribonuclease RuvC [Alphaproteobacteria bacterium]|nr:crossover junction endodeoxyribonuclease RuvC [Alphaproteobacteria bacterium]
MQPAIRILGVDPGLRHTGWGVIEMLGGRLSWLAHGVIEPDPRAGMAERLALLATGLRTVIVDHGPHESAVEETFVNMNPRSTLLLGQARGVALATLAAAGLPVVEFAARKVKQSIVGTGAADKSQVAFMVRHLLPLAGEVSADAADALAVAICGAHHRPVAALKVKA